MRLYSSSFAVRSADVSNPGTARLRSSGLLVPWHRMAMVACSMPASVFSRIAQKRKFSTLSLRSAVENGSVLHYPRGSVKNYITHVALRGRGTTSTYMYNCFPAYTGVFS